MCPCWTVTLAPYRSRVMALSMQRSGVACCLMLLPAFTLQDIQRALNMSLKDCMAYRLPDIVFEPSNAG